MYDLASLLAELFLLADYQPTRHFCSPFPRIGYDLVRLLPELILLADSQPTRHFCSEFPRIGYICK